ncbi:MAG: SLBB domain-containing protein [Pirellulales bacterium]|nr:SLBB domain-containing protein [Pirellulales bacterium]
MSKAPWTSSVVLGVILFGAAGCAQHRYSARSLPCELQAAPIVNPLTLELSSLSGPAVDSELIAPGDVVEVSIAGGMNTEEVIKLSLRVEDNGTAVLPQIGPIHLAGINSGEAERNIAAACVQSGIYRQPQVSVTEKRQRMNRVTVAGAVEEPGVQELPRSSSYLLEALVAAGGLAEDAGTMVEIRRPGNDHLSPANPVMQLASAGGQTPGASPTAQGNIVQCVRLDLTEAVSQSSGGEYLPDGSVVTVQKRQLPPIQVLGLVHKPGEYDYPVGRPVRVLGAIAMAGGMTYNIADRALVIRTREDGSEPAVIKVNLQRAKSDGQENMLLAPGDIVSVEHNLATLFFEAMGLARVGVGASVPLY